MTRYVLDAAAAIELAAGDVQLGDGDELIAPTLLRSQVLSLLHEAVDAGTMTAEEAQRRRAHRRLADAAAR